jgi:hypothetical protein
MKQQSKASEKGADAASATTAYLRGKKHSITVQLPPELMAKVDQAAAEMGQTRNGWISGAIARALIEHERLKR